MHFPVLLCLVLVGLATAYSSSRPVISKVGSIAHPKPTKTAGRFHPRAMSVVEGKATTVAAGESSLPPSIWSKVLASWGVIGVLSIIGNAVRRLVPIALEPIKNGDMNPLRWSVLVSWTAFMTYTEGYSAFQKKFSPLVVKRAFTLADNPGFFNYFLAGPYSMGLFHATSRRLKVSWIISTMVFGIVQVVKRLPYPWRGIADAGVVAGLTYGSLSILMIHLYTLVTGTTPDINAELPEKKVTKNA